MPFSAVIADSQPVVRAGLRSFLANADVRVEDEAQTCGQVIAKTLKVLPDLLVLDAQFPDGAGFDAVAEIRAKEFRGRVAFFATMERQSFFARALAVGADSYLLKKTSRAEFVRVVRALLAATNPDDKRDRLGAAAPYSGEIKRVANIMRRSEGGPFYPLTQREAQVLQNVALGLSNKEIAAALTLSLDTVKEHVQHIFRKLDVSDRAQAAVWAVRNKLIP